MSNPAAIGQLTAEPFWIRNLFDPRTYDYHIITPPLNDKVNRAVYDFVLRGMSIRQIPDFQWPQGAEGIREDGNHVYYFHKASWMEHTFAYWMHNRKPDFYYSLNEKDREKAIQVRKRFHIPLEAEIVVVHNREPGWRPELKYHSYRDADINNYVPAMQYLSERGYYIVRIGDKSHRPLPNISHRVIDLPVHPQYSPDADLYLTAQSKFFISAPSGPLSLAVGFGIPVLWVNMPVLAGVWSNPGDVFVPKRYYSRHLSRYLSYSEIVTSDLLHYFRTEEYEKFGVELQENTAEELLRAVREMDARLRGDYADTGTLQTIQDRVKTIELQGHNRRRHACPQYPFFSIYLSQMQLSCEFLKINPWFIEERHWV
ncbi:MAG: TIGR04372 family glycosyltransferase [Sedimentisphaerales bacterium]|nr:TIGR04372 family glycosyltransferase [Sedimentisphaerales bacterium]